jgi:hypothetical protein
VSRNLFHIQIFYVSLTPEYPPLIVELLLNPKLSFVCSKKDVYQIKAGFLDQAGKFWIGNTWDGVSEESVTRQRAVGCKEKGATSEDQSLASA